jgi:hypothetical protein
MNEEQLRNRLKQADPAANSPLLSESAVVESSLKNKRGSLSFRFARFSLASAAAALLAAGLTMPSILAPQQPLFGLSDAPPRAHAMSRATEAGDSAARMMWPGWIQYNYIFDGLSTQGGRGVVYEVRKVGDPIALLMKIAEVFGISGEAKENEWSSKEYPSYSIQGENFYVDVYWYGAGFWSFNRWNTMEYCVEPAEGEDSSSNERCLTPQPTPQLIPGEAELIAQAISTFDKFGIKVSRNQIDVYRDDWGATATASTTFNGQPLPIDYYISWGMDGKISLVSAASFEVVERGEFGTVSAQDAVARIKDGRWYGGVSSRYYQQYNRPVSSTTKDSSSGASTEGSVGTEDQPIETSAPIDEWPTEPKIIDLRINRSEVVLVSVYDKAGSMWLVPGYLLFNDQGWFDSIISLVEGVIELPEPYTVMPIEESNK